MKLVVSERTQRLEQMAASHAAPPLQTAAVAVVLFGQVLLIVLALELLVPQLQPFLSLEVQLQLLLLSTAGCLQLHPLPLVVVQSLPLRLLLTVGRRLLQRLLVAVRGLHPLALAAG